MFIKRNNNFLKLTKSNNSYGKKCKFCNSFSCSYYDVHSILQYLYQFVHDAPQYRLKAQITLEDLLTCDHCKSMMLIENQAEHFWFKLQVYSRLQCHRVLGKN